MQIEKLLLSVLILTLPLGQFSRLPVETLGLPDVSVYLNDLLIPLLLFVWLTRQLAIKKRLELPPFSGLVMLFAAISLLSLVNGFRWLGIKELIISGLYWWRWVEYAFLYPVVYSLTSAYRRGRATQLHSQTATQPRTGHLRQARGKLRGQYRVTRPPSLVTRYPLPFTLYPLRIINLLLLATAAFSLLGLLQFFFFPDFSQFVPHGWDPHYYRLLSTFFDPNFAGIFLILGFILAASLLLTIQPRTRPLESVRNSGPDPSGRYGVNHSTIRNNTLKRVSSGGGKRVSPGAAGLTNFSLLSERNRLKPASPAHPINRLFLTVNCLLLTVCCLFTFSRSTYLAFIVAIIGLGLLKSRKLLIAFLILAILAFMFIPRVQTRVVGALELDITARARIADWLKTWEIVKDNWLTGVGFNAFRYAQERYGYFRSERGLIEAGGHAGAGADSSLLFVWATTGIFGLITYLLLFGGIWLEAVLRLRKCKMQNAKCKIKVQSSKLKTKIKPSREPRFVDTTNNNQTSESIFRLSLQEALLLTLVVSIPALFVHAQFVNSLFYPWVMAWVWVVLGITFGVSGKPY